MEVLNEIIHERGTIIVTVTKHDLAIEGRCVVGKFSIDIYPKRVELVVLDPFGIA
jgi:hypothetical protein